MRIYLRMNMRMSSNRRKKAVNLSVDAELLREAKGSGLNLSAILERALAEERARRWRGENKQAIESYNRSIEQNGVWSDGWRSW